MSILEMPSHILTNETIPTHDLPRHCQPPPSSAFIPYLIQRLRSEDTSHRCYVLGLSPIGRERTHASYGEEHNCINFSGVDIFRYAQEFDKGPQSKGQRSTLIVNILTVFFIALMIPVCLVILLINTIPRLLWDMYHMSPVAENVSFDIHFHLYQWSRLAVIWVVYVPQTKIAGMGGLAAILVPSLRPASKHAHQNTVEEGKRRMGPRLKAKQKLEKFYNRLLNEEFQALHKVASLSDPEVASPNDPEVAASPSNPEVASLSDSKAASLNDSKVASLSNPDVASPTDPEAVLDAFESFKAKANSTRTVKGYLAELTAELDDIEEIVATEACFQRTGYKGVADWANDAWNANQNLINALIAVCMLGVGLTFTSLFSTNRDNIGFRYWSFSLFMSGLALSTMTQLLLLWSTQLPRDVISMVSVCQLFLGICLYSAVGFLVTAVYVLVLSMYRQSHAAHPPALLAFSIMGTCALVTLVTSVLFSSVGGAKVFLRTRISKPKRSLQDYPMFDANRET